MTAAEIAVLTDDPQIRSELETAADALLDTQVRLRFATDRYELFEMIRSRSPRFALANFGKDPGDVGRLAKELSAELPPVPLVAMFDSNAIADDIDESSVLIEALRSGVKDFLRRPFSTTELRTLLEQVGHDGTDQVPATSTALGRVVTFISNKGGVGKSTLATNTAVGLAKRHPGRVLLVDGSLQMGVAAALLDVQPEATFSDVAAERDRLDETLLRQLAAPTQYGLHLLAAPRDAVEAMQVDDALMSRIITLGRRVFDYVIVDTFPMFDRVVVATLDLSDRAYIVLENVIPTLLGGAKLLEVLERIGFPEERQRLIMNRSKHVTGSLSLVDVETRLGRGIDHVFPYDKQVIAAANLGRPVATQNAKIGFGGFNRPLWQMIGDVEAMRGGVGRQVVAGTPSSVEPTVNNEA